METYHDAAPNAPLDGAADAVVEPAVREVERWLVLAADQETPEERAITEALHGVVVDPASVAFVMRYVDRVVRPEDDRVAARQLASLVERGDLPAFLGPLDRLLLRVGALAGRVLPGVVIPLGNRRMRRMVGRLVVDSDPVALARHLAERRAEGFRQNVNLLGEAVLGEAEADRRHESAMQLLEQPDVDYVSVKVSSVVAQLNPWDHDGSVERVVDRLRPLFVEASTTEPRTFVNLDLEEYHDLDVTVDAFIRLLDEPELHSVDAGIVLQAYLPDAFGALQRLVRWAGERHDRTIGGRPGGRIKVRLVKGANLAMERVDAAIHGWTQAPYATKAETDANYKRCLDWVFTAERMRAVNIGVASHNLFDVAWAHLLAEHRGVAEHVEFEMLQGMAPAQARVARDAAGSVLLYTPAVSERDFDVAISYLFRRLEENASSENFIRHLFDLRAGTDAFDSEATKFRSAVRDRWEVGSGPRRDQDRSMSGSGGPGRCRSDVDGGSPRFSNEPDTDPALPVNRAWARAVLRKPTTAPSTPVASGTPVIDEAVATVRRARPAWTDQGPSARRAVLYAIADELARRRGDLIAVMVGEANKTFAQADIEVSEAIDFARWYGDRALDLDRRDGARFEPLGVVAVVPPWNFPVAIPAGGVLAALAAGNGVVFKPAPETPRCAEIVAECCWSGGVPDDVLRFVRTHDDEVGRHLIAHRDVDAVILTGAYETAELFRSWDPERRIFAETSGKNAIVVTPHADLDLAVADVVASAFGHSGQKCSAASLVICVGDVYESERFRRQLVDAVASLCVGPADDLATTMGPMVHPPTGKLERALTTLEPGESWLVTPRRVRDDIWTPGVRVGVRRGSWFHQTECFGPVLGVMAARSLDEAIELQNDTPFGLTGGLQTLDPDEVDVWLDRVQVGNAYVNRGITGAIVQRQPFGGWNRSSIGPGAKAGGPNYVAQLGTWRADPAPRLGRDLDHDWLAAAADSDARAWHSEFSVDHDPTALFCESNVLRYRPLERIAVRVAPSRDGRTDGESATALARVLAAAEVCGVETIVSRHDDESATSFAARLSRLGVVRVRILGSVEREVRERAHAAGIHLADDPVTADGRVELLHHLREQSVSRTLHRYGNLVGS